MKKFCASSLYLILNCYFNLSCHADSYWNLPSIVNDKNTEVRFDVDSTWHMVHGKTAGINGKIWLEDPSNLSSIHAEIHLPIKLFDTDNSRRDKRMREVMDESDYPDVVFQASSVSNLCSPEEVSRGETCQGILHGTLSIKGITREIALPFTLKQQSNQYEVSGSMSFEWSLFGIEDPSIVIARLNKVVTIHYICKLLPQS